MTDNEVNAALRKQIVKQLTEQNIQVPVIAGYQSKKAGRENNFVMFFNVVEGGHGWQGRRYNPIDDNANHVEVQKAEKTIQVQGFCDDSSGLTALDLTATVRMIVNSLPFVEALKKSGVGIQRASAVRTPFFENDRGDYEMNPSFDFKVTFDRSIKPKTSVIRVITPQIKQI